MITAGDPPRVMSYESLPPTVLRAMAVGAGDWSLVVAREVEEILSRTAKDRPAAFGQGIDELRSRGVIESADVDDLKSIVRAFFGVTRDPDSARAAEETILRCYRRLSLSDQASPAAIAIASVAARNLSRPPAGDIGERPGVAAITVTYTPPTTGAGALAGAMVGAAVGAAVGGFAGAGIGAAIGSAAGAAVGFSNEHGI